MSPLRRRMTALLAVGLFAGAAFLLLRPDPIEPGAGSSPDEPRPAPDAPVEVAGPGDGVLETGGSGRRAPSPRGGPGGATAAPGPAAPSAAPPAVDPAGPFEGVCVDEDGAPVAGATVQVVSGRAGPAGVDRSAFEESRAGADGRFTVGAPPAVGSIRVRARGPGRVAARADEEMVRGEAARIVLLRAVDVRVRVVEKDGGGAVRGARVSLFSGDENASSGDVDFEIHPPLDETTTDDTGRAVLRAPGGPCAVLAKAASRSPRLVGPLFVPRAGLDLQVVLERGGSLRGRVLDEADRPVVGARVHGAARLGWRGQATTDADGAFRFDGLPDPPPAPAQDQEILDPNLRVAVEAAGYPLHAFEWDLGDLLDPLHSDSPLDLHLHRAGPVSGAVTAAAGALPAGSTVRLVPSIRIPEGIPVPPLPTAVLPGPDGTFRFEDVGLLPVSVVAEAPDGRSVPVNYSVQWPGGGGGGHTTTRRAGAGLQEPTTSAGIVALRVTDAHGRGVAGVHLEHGVGDGSVFHLKGTSATDADGRATFGRWAHTSHVIVFPPGRPVFAATLPADGEVEGEVSIVLPAGRAQGRVRRLGGGGAAPGLWVSTLLDRISAPQTTVGQVSVSVTTAGEFVVDGLGSDVYALSAEEPFTLVRAPRFEAGARLDLLAVTPVEAVGLQVAVRLEAPEGASVDWATLELRDGAGTAFPCFLRATGEPGVWLSEPPVPPGAYSGTVHATGFLPAAIPSVRIDGGDRSPRVTVPLAR